MRWARPSQLTLGEMRIKALPSFVRDLLNLAKAGLLILVEKPQPACGQGTRRRCGAGDLRKNTKALHAAAAAAATAAVKGRDCPQRREIYDTSSYGRCVPTKKSLLVHNYRVAFLSRKKEGR